MEKQRKPTIKFLFEGQEYDKKEVYDKYLPINVRSWKFKENKLDLVGYYVKGNPDSCQVELVYFLPKVFVKNEIKKAFGEYEIKKDQPLDVTDIAKEGSDDDKAIKDMLDILPVWLGKALSYYRSRKQNSDIVKEVEQEIFLPSDSEHESTLTERIYSLEDFYMRHKDLVLFIYQQANTGFHKINWSKTIRKKMPVFLDYEGNLSPVYLETVTRKKTINYDEELMVLFFDTLQYIVNEYNYPIPFESLYEMTPIEEFKDKVKDELIIPRMEEIRNNYFSDQLTELWNLLYAFHVKNADVTHGRKEDYMLVNAFHAVFEDMVDSLISDNELLTQKHQADNKRIDHLFLGKSLFDDSNIYYVADSKYYLDDDTTKGSSLGKQFTYVNNILQDAMDAFNNDDQAWKDKGVYYYDPKTEGFNVTPNFFLRGNIPDNSKDLSFDEEQLTSFEMEEKKFYRERCYHKYRLFDRNTQFLLQYSLNFLFLLKYYNDYNAFERKNLQRKLESIVREDMIERLKNRYVFIKIEDKDKIDKILNDHFKTVLGRVMYFKNGDFLILAIDKQDENFKNILDSVIVHCYKTVEYDFHT